MIVSITKRSETCRSPRYAAGATPAITTTLFTTAIRAASSFALARPRLNLAAKEARNEHVHEST
jgi:hypothetical protein